MVKKKQEDTFKVRGEELLQKVKDLIHEGNVRKIILKGKDGKTIGLQPDWNVTLDPTCQMAGKIIGLQPDEWLGM